MPSPYTMYYSSSLENLEQYLAMLCSRGKDANEPNPANCALSILAARLALNVEENNKKALVATKIKGKADIKKSIAAQFEALSDAQAIQDYLEERVTSPRAFKKIVGNGHGGALERDLREFVRNYKGPIPEDTPERYRPTALGRIEALQARLKKLPKNALYAENAAKLCMEIAAVRSVVNSVPGDKSSLKKQYDPAAANAQYESLTQKGILDRMKNDPALLNRMVKEARTGHGGAMEKDVRDLVFQETISQQQALAGVPERYRPSYEQCVAQLRERYQPSYGQYMTRLGERYRTFHQKMEDGQTLTEAEKLELRDVLRDYCSLKSAFTAHYKQMQTAKSQWKEEREHFGEPIDAAKFNDGKKVHYDDLLIVTERLTQNPETRKALLEQVNANALCGTENIISEQLTRVDEDRKVQKKKEEEEYTYIDQNETRGDYLQDSMEHKILAESEDLREDWYSGRVVPDKYKNDPNIDYDAIAQEEKEQAGKDACKEQFVQVLAYDAIRRKCNDPKITGVHTEEAYKEFYEKFAKEVKGEQWEKNCEPFRNDPVLNEYLQKTSVGRLLIDLISQERVLKKYHELKNRKIEDPNARPGTKMKKLIEDDILEKTMDALRDLEDNPKVAEKEHSLKMKRMCVRRIIIAQSYQECSKNGIVDEKKLAHMLSGEEFQNRCKTLRKSDLMKDMFSKMNTRQLALEANDGAAIVERFVNHVKETEKKAKEAQKDDPNLSKQQTEAKTEPKKETVTTGQKAVI